MTYDFSGKTCFITGASRGLGRQLAELFWQYGANLLLVARSIEQLNQVKIELGERPKQTLQLLPIDLAQPNAADILSHHDIDILINNAAIHGPIGPVWENDWQAWQTTLQVNLITPVALCRAVIPKMIQRRCGKIINLSGGGATAARPQFSAYAVAKAGLVRFTETLAEEVKDYAIDVNCVAPGVMKTALLAEVLEAGKNRVGEKEFSQAEKASDSVILRAAELCLFLASNKSHGISGKLISAMWDPWMKLPEYLNELKNSDIYTLRRIVPNDRGKVWGEVS